MSIIRGSISEPSFQWRTELVQLLERKVTDNTLELKMLCPGHGGSPIPRHRRSLGAVQLGHLGAQLIL